MGQPVIGSFLYSTFSLESICQSPQYLKRVPSSRPFLPCPLPNSRPLALFLLVSLVAPRSLWSSCQPGSMTCWLSPPVNFLPYLSFLFPGSDLYGHSLTLPLERPATCMWHSLSRPWDLQATMHFPGEGTSLRSGGWAQIHLCWMVLGLGWRKAQVISGILRSMASQ